MKRKLARRIISLVIALMMTLSGTQVFFADTSPYNYGENDIVINKTATLIGDNEYEIQLSVIGKDINTGKRADVILVIDNSGSMHTAEYNGKKLAEITKDAANAFVDGVLTSANDLSGNVRIGVVKYGEQANARIFSGSGSWSDNWRNSLDLDNITVYTSNKADAKSAVSKATEYVTNVGTNTEGGFLMAQKVAAQKRSDAESIVIFMTDGMPTYRYSGTDTSTDNDSSGNQTSKRELNEAIEAAQVLGTNSKIYTVALLSAVQSSSNQAKLASNLLSLSPYKYDSIFNPSSIINDVNQSSKWIATTAYAEKYFSIFSGDNAAAKMQEIYETLAGTINALANGYVTDIIHKNFVLTAASKSDLQSQGVTVTENDDGTTTLVFPNISASGTINNLPKIIVSVKPGTYGTDYTNEEAIYTFKLFGEQTEKTKEFPKPIVPIDPVAEDDSYSVYKDSVLTVSSLGILNNDTPLKVVAGDYTVTELAVENTYVTTITTNQGGTAMVSSDGSFVYTPPSEFTGTDTFAYKNMANVSGGGVLSGDYVSNTATVTINVLPIPVNEIAYIVEYYKDGTIMAGETVNGLVPIDNPVVNSVVHKTPVGYALDEEASTELPFTVTEENNVIKIYYVKEIVPEDLVEYTVEYYKDGDLVETVTGTVPADNPVVNSVDDKTPAGYVLDEEATTELPFTVTEEDNVIKIYYVKDTSPEVPVLEDNVVIVKHYTKTGTAARVLAKTDAPIPVTTSATIYGTVYKDSTIVSQGFAFDSSDPEFIDVYPRTTTESAIKQFVFELLYTKSGSSGGGGDGGGGGNGGGGNPPVVIDDNQVPLAELEKTDHFAYIIGYPEGDVRPMNNITREEVAMIFYRLLTDESRDALLSDTNPFTDLDGDRWSNRAISTLYNADIVSGYPDGTFRPSDPITRAEFATIAAKFDDLSLENVTEFTDITGHWAEEYITSSENKGWIKGYPDMTFKPEQDITRAEGMTLINNVLDRIVPEENIHPDAIFWPDNPKAEWYYEAVMEATNSHDYVIEEDGDELWTGMKPNKVWP